MRWRGAALCCAGGLLATAGAILAALLAGRLAPGTGAWAAGLGGLCAALVLAVPLGFRAAQRVDGSLRRVIAGLEAWAGGRMTERLPPEEGDLAALAAACNALAESVEERLRAQRRLADANARLLHRNAELAALQERHRIARDLHDAVSQRLFGMHLLAAAAARGSAPAPEIRELEHLSREAQSEMRALLLQLRPPALRRLDLGEALAELCAGAGGAGDEAPAWSLELDPVPPLGPAAEDGLYRIAQEAVANVLRHADAAQASVSLRLDGGRLILAVDDDGRGFTVSAAARSPGMGLTGIRERAAAIGAAVRLRSQPGRGTRIEAILPVLAAPPGPPAEESP